VHDPGLRYGKVPASLEELRDWEEKFRERTGGRRELAEGELPAEALHGSR